MKFLGAIIPCLPLLLFSMIALAGCVNRPPGHLPRCQRTPDPEPKAIISATHKERLEKWAGRSVNINDLNDVNKLERKLTDGELSEYHISMTVELGWRMFVAEGPMRCKGMLITLGLW